MYRGFAGAGDGETCTAEVISEATNGAGGEMRKLEMADAVLKERPMAEFTRLAEMFIVRTNVPSYQKVTAR